MKEKVIVSTSTLFASLLAYWYAKRQRKDIVPYIMWGGFIGNLIGEAMVSGIKLTGEYSSFKATDNL